MLTKNEPSDTMRTPPEGEGGSEARRGASATTRSGSEATYHFSRADLSDRTVAHQATHSPALSRSAGSTAEQRNVGEGKRKHEHLPNSS